MVNCFNMPKKSINEIKRITYVFPKLIETHQIIYTHWGYSTIILKYFYLKQKQSKNR